MQENLSILIVAGRNGTKDNVHIGLTQQVYKLEFSGPSERVIAKSRPTSTSVAISIEFQDQERHTP